MTKLKVGLVGFGLSGETFHSPFYQRLEEFELTAVLSSKPEKVHKKFPNAHVVSEFDQVISDPDVDLVVITTPTETHYSFAKQALLAGKHVVVEKPFTTHADEAVELIRIAEEKGKRLSVFQNRRWDNDFLTLKSIIESGALGEINFYESHFDRYRPTVVNRWKEQNLPGAGILYDLGSHLIDQALHLFGLPETVYGDVQIQREGGQVEDYFHIILSYGKLRVILHTGSIVKSNGPRFQVHGSKGSFIKYGLDSQEGQLRQGKGPGDSLWGNDDPEQYGELTLNVGDLSLNGKVETLTGSYESFYHGLYESITANKPVPVSPVDALHVIQVIESVRLSSKEKRIVDFKRGSC